MANTTFSFQKPDNSKIKGTEVSFKIWPIWASKPVTVADSGLIMASGLGAKQSHRFFAPLNNPVKGYTSAAGGAALVADSRLTPKAAENIAILDITYSQVLSSESLDIGLFDNAGNINSAVLADLGFAGRRYAALKWYKEALGIAFGYKDTADTKNLITLTDVEAAAVSSADSDVLEILEKIQAAIAKIETTITKYSWGVPKSEIFILCSKAFYDLVGRIYSALGRQPEYVQMSGQKTLSISEIPLRVDIMLGAEIAANQIHKTETLDTSNFWAVIVQRQVISAITGATEMWSNRDLDTNNPINGMKGIMGLKVFKEFKENFVAIIKAKTDLVDPTA